MTNLKIDRDAWGRLVLILGDGTTHVGVEPVRCFPLSDPLKAIALLDPEGHEILTLPDLDSLNPESKQILELERLWRAPRRTIRRRSQRPCGCAVGGSQTYRRVRGRWCARLSLWRPTQAATVPAAWLTAHL